MIEFANNASSKLGASCSDSTTTLTVVDGAVFPALSAGDYFMITVVDDADNMEIMKCTGLSGNTLTVIRAQEDTTARAFQVGSIVENRLTEQSLKEILNVTYATKEEAYAGVDNTKAISAQVFKQAEASLTDRGTTRMATLVEASGGAATSVAITPYTFNNTRGDLNKYGVTKLASTSDMDAGSGQQDFHVNPWGVKYMVEKFAPATDLSDLEYLAMMTSYKVDVLAMKERFSFSGLLQEIFLSEFTSGIETYQCSYDAANKAYTSGITTEVNNFDVCTGDSAGSTGSYLWINCEQSLTNGTSLKEVSAYHGTAFASPELYILKTNQAIGTAPTYEVVARFTNGVQTTGKMTWDTGNLALPDDGARYNVGLFMTNGLLSDASPAQDIASIVGHQAVGASFTPTFYANWGKTIKISAICEQASQGTMVLQSGPHDFSGYNSVQALVQGIGIADVEYGDFTIYFSKDNRATWSPIYYPEGLGRETPADPNAYGDMQMAYAADLSTLAGDGTQFWWRIYGKLDKKLGVRAVSILGV